MFADLKINTFMAAAFPVGFPYSVPPKPFPTSQSKAENGYSHPNSAKTLKHTVTPLHPLKLHRERITALRACLTKRTGHPTHRYHPRPQTHFQKLILYRTHSIEIILQKQVHVTITPGRPAT